MKFSHACLNDTPACKPTSQELPLDVAWALFQDAELETLKASLNDDSERTGGRWTPTDTSFLNFAQLKAFKVLKFVRGKYKGFEAEVLQILNACSEAQLDEKLDSGIVDTEATLHDLASHSGSAGRSARIAYILPTSLHEPGRTVELFSSSEGLLMQRLVSGELANEIASLQEYRQNLYAPARQC